MQRRLLAHQDSVVSEDGSGAPLTSSAALRLLPARFDESGSVPVWFPPEVPEARDDDDAVEPTAAVGLLACLRRARQGPAVAVPGPRTRAAAARGVSLQLQRRPIVCGRGQDAPDMNGFSIFDGVGEAERGELLGLALQDASGQRAIGSMVGMAVADAVGHMFEFVSVGESGHLFDAERLVCSGVYNRFHLKPGQWTDDTSMGLCLADSLLVCDGYSGSDIRKRFWNWWFRGYNNAFRLDGGRCDSVGLGGNIRSSMSRMPPEPTPRFEELGGNQDAGNGSLMRLSPVPVYFHRDPALAARVSAESSLTTHPGPIAADACSFLGFAIARAINRPEGDGASAAQFLDECCEAYKALPDARGRDTLLKLLAASEPPGSTERCWNWRDPDGPYLLETLEARGPDYNGYPVLPHYFGSYSMDGLALALHSVYHTSTFMAAIARCINFLGDSDSHGAICGQLAGAFYGATAIDERLVAALEVWDQGEIALRAALLHSLGAELSEDAVAAAMAATAQDAEPTAAKRPRGQEAPSPGAWVPPSVARKKKQEEEEKASKHIIEVMAAGDDGMSGFAVYPRTHCPHLKQYGELPKPPCISMKARCSVCGEDEVWICAFCGASLCSRYKNAHMLQHSAEEDHPVGLSLSDLSFWCFKCDSYLDVFAIKALHPLYTEAHVAKFGEAPPLPSSAQLPDPGSSSSSSSAL